VSWKGFERIIEKIHRQWSPDAQIQHDERVRGHSGRQRQLDVTIRTRVGPYSILIVVECKEQLRPVGISQVEAFAKKLEDVGASQGVMVSRSGFDDGARAIAAQNQIRLLNYRDAEDEDWRKVVGDNVHFFFTVSEAHQEQTKVDCGDNDENPLDDSDLILTPTGHRIGTVKEVRGAIIRNVLLPAPLLGNYEMIIDLEGFRLQSRDGLNPIHTMTIRGRKVARRFFFRADSTAGHIIEDALNGEIPFAELEQTVPWGEIAEASPGQSLSVHEYVERSEPTETLPIALEWSDRNGELHLVFRRLDTGK
jgi:Restriction endonuclease